MIPGELRTQRRARSSSTPGRDTIDLTVLNTGDRPIQVGSHFHVADVNAALQLDREAATGFRFDIPAGTSLRFEPGALEDRHAREARRPPDDPRAAGKKT